MTIILQLCRADTRGQSPSALPALFSCFVDLLFLGSSVRSHVEYCRNVVCSWLVTYVVLLNKLYSFL